MVRIFIVKEAPPMPEKIELSMLIPSKDVLTQIEKEHRIFADKEMATLIENASITRDEKSHLFKLLLERITDEKLGKEIENLLLFDEKSRKAFFSHTEGTVYLLYIQEEGADEFYGIFAEPEEAYRYGRRAGTQFTIVKRPILGGGEYRTVSDKEFGKLSLADGIHSNDGDELGKILFDEYGRVVELYVWEIPAEEREMLTGDDDFDNSIRGRYVSMPNPFERGDIVRRIGWKDDCGNDEIGVVSTSHKSWEKYEREYFSGEAQLKGWTPDYSDVQIVVDMVDRAAVIGHAHINPIHLEKITEEDYGCLRQWDVVSCMSAVIRGDANFEYFQMIYDRDRC